MTPDWLESLASLPRDGQLEYLLQLTPEELAETDRDILREEPAIWVPQPGPQTAAYECLADELFFGGSAGGGKSDVLLGLAGTAHHHSIIFRREFPQHRALIERSRVIYNALSIAHSKDSYNESLHRWTLAGGRMIEFGALEHEKDKENYRGRPHDFLGWDEVTQCTESQFRFVNAWCRSTKEGQRCRIVATGNPPTTSEGEWVIRYWAPWLDAKHSNPAEPGELRWFARIGNKDVQVDNGQAFVYKSETITPRSRTFIPARLADNPILEKTGYRSVLQGMPEPLRSQMLYGDFGIGLDDDAWQVIPTEWVRAAQKRWTPEGHIGRPLTSIGVDPAYGGRDSTVIAKLHGTWFAPLVKIQGTETNTGEKTAALIVKEHVPGAAIHIDAIGYGAAAYEALKRYEHIARSSQIVAINSEYPIASYDRSRRFRLVNVRAACWWKMREALDPENGDNLALPPDPELLADLCAPRYELTPSGIKLEKKDKIIERIGRSPDSGDAAVYALWWTGGHASVPDPELIAHIAKEKKAEYNKHQTAWMSEEREEAEDESTGSNQSRRGMFGR